MEIPLENGDSANGEAPARTLSREDSLYGDAFVSPTNGDDSDKIVAIVEEDFASTATETEAVLHRVKEEKIALEKEIEEMRRAQMALATEASRLDGEMVRVQSDLFTAEAEAKAVQEEANKLKSEVDLLNKALQESKRQWKEVAEKFVGEEKNLVGQIEALKQELIALEELTETKQHNASLQVDIGNSRQSVAVSAAQTHQDMTELMKRKAHLEAEILKKMGKEEEGVVVVGKVTILPNWAGNAVAATLTGAVAATVFISRYFCLRKQQ